MKVTLINPSRIIQEGNIWKKINHCLPPLGLAYIAGYIEKKGIDVEIIDLEAEGLSEGELARRIKSRKPDFVGITVTTAMASSALKIAGIIKEAESSTITVAGGIHAAILPEEMLRSPYMDIVVRTEGEIAFHELVTSKDRAKVRGISYKRGNRIVHNPDREPIANLDSLPFPAYHLIPMKEYKPSMGNYKRLPAISIMATRGCPGKCTFCYPKIFGKRVRNHSVGYIIREIKMLVSDYGIKEISFYDDTFTANRKFVEEFCSKVIREKVDITWSCMSRADCLSYPLLELMKKAGCHQIGIGIESADPKILSNIKKMINLKEMENAADMIKKAGIDFRAMFMFGNPGETPETIEKTISYALKLSPDLALFNIATPFPGTEMFQWAKSNGYLKTLDWDKYDLLNVVMELPTIKSDEVRYYYKQAYRKFYMRLSYILKRIFKIKSLNDVRNNFVSFKSLIGF